MEPAAIQKPPSVLLARLAPPLVVAAAFLHNLWLSWRAWGDLVVDCGRELELPRELLEGKSLYVNVRCYYGPFSPWFNALLYKIFGVNSGALCAAGIITAALVCWLLYRLARLFVDRLPATACAVAFLYLCAFAQLTYTGAFNFALPYSYGAVYGVLWSLASLFFLLRHVRKQKPLDFLISVGCLFFTALCKLETMLPALLIHSAFLLAAWRGKSWRWKLHGTAYGFCCAALLGIYGYYYAQAGPDLFTYNLLNIGPPSLKRYVLDKAGFFDLPGTLGAAGLSLLALAGSAVAALGLARWRGTSAFNGLLAGVLAAGIFAFLPWENMFAGLTWLWSAALLYALLEMWRERQSQPSSARLSGTLLLLFALGALARMPLRAQAQHYGFYMLPASLVTVAVFFSAFLPRVLKRFNTGTDEPRAPACAWAGAATGILICAAVRALLISQIIYPYHSVALETSRGHMRLLEGAPGLPQGARVPGLTQGSALRDAVLELSKYPPSTTVLALPQGTGLTFFSGLRNPYPSLAYTPSESFGKYGGERLAIALKANPPDLILYVDSSVGEYGEGEFADGYGAPIWEWVKSRYRITARFPPDSSAPSVLLLTRSDLDARPGK